MGIEIVFRETRASGIDVHCGGNDVAVLRRIYVFGSTSGNIFVFSDIWDSDRSRVQAADDISESGWVLSVFRVCWIGVLDSGADDDTAIGVRRCEKSETIYWVVNLQLVGGGII